MSIVRENMLKQLGYVPYCGSDSCTILHWPRATFNGAQFVCRCGWVSKFEPEFIERYKAAQKALVAPAQPPAPADAGSAGSAGSGDAPSGDGGRKG